MRFDKRWGEPQLQDEQFVQAVLQKVAQALPEDEQSYEDWREAGIRSQLNFNIQNPEERWENASFNWHEKGPNYYTHTAVYNKIAAGETWDDDQIYTFVSYLLDKLEADTVLSFIQIIILRSNSIYGLAQISSALSGLHVHVWGNDEDKGIFSLPNNFDHSVVLQTLSLLNLKFQTLLEADGRSFEEIAQDLSDDNTAYTVSWVIQATERIVEEYFDEEAETAFYTLKFIAESENPLALGQQFMLSSLTKMGKEEFANSQPEFSQLIFAQIHRYLIQEPQAKYFRVNKETLERVITAVNSAPILARTSGIMGMWNWSPEVRDALERIALNAVTTAEHSILNWHNALDALKSGALSIRDFSKKLERSPELGIFSVNVALEYSKANFPTLGVTAHLDRLSALPNAHEELKEAVTEYLTAQIDEALAALSSWAEGQEPAGEMLSTIADLGHMFNILNWVDGIYGRYSEEEYDVDFLVQAKKLYERLPNIAQGVNTRFDAVLEEFETLDSELSSFAEGLVRAHRNLIEKPNDFANADPYRKLEIMFEIAQDENRSKQISEDLANQLLGLLERSQQAVHEYSQLYFMLYAEPFTGYGLMTILALITRGKMDTTSLAKMNQTLVANVDVYARIIAQSRKGLYSQRDYSAFDFTKHVEDDSSLRAQIVLAEKFIGEKRRGKDVKLEWQGEEHLSFGQDKFQTRLEDLLQHALIWAAN